MDNQWWSWALSIIGATCFYLAGKKVWWTWYLGLFTQMLWLGYTLVTQQWGFLVGVFLYTFVYSKNARDWTRDHFRPVSKLVSRWGKPLETGSDVGSLSMYCSAEGCPGYRKGAPAKVFADGILHTACIRTLEAPKLEHPIHDDTHATVIMEPGDTLIYSGTPMHFYWGQDDGGVLSVAFKSDPPGA